MNYIREINAFYIRMETAPLSTGAVALWHTLLHINNRAGWVKEFAVAAAVLCYKSGLSESGLRRARKELHENGWITVESRGTKAPLYRMVSGVHAVVGEGEVDEFAEKKVVREGSEGKRLGGAVDIDGMVKGKVRSGFYGEMSEGKAGKETEALTDVLVETVEVTKHLDSGEKLDVEANENYSELAEMKPEEMLITAIDMIERGIVEESPEQKAADIVKKGMAKLAQEQGKVMATNRFKGEVAGTVAGVVTEDTAEEVTVIVTGAKAEDGSTLYKQNNTKQNKNKTTTTSRSSSPVSTFQSIAFYTKHYGAPTKSVQKQIISWAGILGDKLVVQALQRTHQYGKEWAYAVGILRKWKQNNLYTMEDVLRAEQDFRERRKSMTSRTGGYSYQAAAQSTEVVPDWFRKLKEKKRAEQQAEQEKQLQLS